MNVKKFIDRPILSAVISIVIVLAGVIGLFTLPVEQYPDIAPPTIQVSTSYPGASAETLQKSVVAPLEEAINGVEGMTYMTSTATNSGSVTITVYFKQGMNPDMAAVNVQNKVARATAQLPAEVTQIGVTVQKRQSSMLKIFSLYSPDSTYDEGFLANYVAINLKPEIQRIFGVGDIMVMGGDYSMRIWMKPDVMAQYKLVPSDISRVLAEQNIESAVGNLGENGDVSFQYTMRYKGRLVQPEEFGDIVIQSDDNGRVLRLKDVADIELGRNSYAYIGQTNGKPGISCMIFQTAGSNATEVNNSIDKFLEEAAKDLPPGVEIIELMSVNDFLEASINDVIKTLIEAILLVIFIVYIFLQDLRSTIIPSVAIVISLIGTFAFLQIAGFSINLLTLFALILAIGTVVDDAIVVVEAVQERFDSGYRSPYKAAVDAMGSITSAVITTTIVFMSVFIPVTFMGGTAGTFYTQFGVTMAIAVAISTLNALTLSPALCALILKPYLDENGQAKDNFAARFRKAFNTAFSVMVDKYKNGVMFFIRRQWLSGILVVAAIIGLTFLMMNTKTGLVPDEDKGTVFISVNTAPGTSLLSTSEIMDQVESRIVNIPEIRTYSKVSGYNMLAGQGSANGMFIVKLEDWDERTKPESSVKGVIGRIYGLTADVKDARVFAMAPGMIPGYGMGNGFDLQMQDRTDGSVEDFFNVTQSFLSELRQRPEISSAYSPFDIRFPQWMIDIDAAKAKRAGITPNEILSTLSGYYGSQYVSNINRFSKVYRVMIQSSPEYRLDKESLDNIFVRVNGEMAPVSQFVTMEKVYGPEALSRFNMFNSIAVNGAAADGYSSGDAIKAIREVAHTSLPKGYSFDFGGITREESAEGSNTVIIFSICIILVYLVLCALYESFLIPFAVILSVPFGLVGSFFFAKIIGLENNIYLQTGLIMLIGLLSKTAILLTEFASARRAQGMSIVSAALSAAKVRLRPILMTALTMIFGLLPLIFAKGVGANGNISLGVGTVGGMIVGTLALLFIVPSLFIFFQSVQEKIRPMRFSENADRQIEAEMHQNRKDKMKRREQE